MALVYARVPHPPVINRIIPNSQTSAWNDLGPRNPVGTVQHTMVGSLWGTDLWFRDNPQTGHVAQGLTDYGVGGATDGEYDGVIFQWNDPRGRRSGWANGGSDGLEGDGIAFVRTLGVNAINRDLVSIERSDGGKYATQPISPKQFESLAQLHAYWADQARIPYTEYPRNPNIVTPQYPKGIITYLEHREFAIKGCPYAPVMNEVTRLQARIREILKQYQGEAAVEPTPPTKPAPEPASPWPNGWTTEQLKAQFGAILRIDVTNGKANMTVRELFFDEKGVISNAWVNRAQKEGITEVSRIPKPSHLTITASKDGVTSQMAVFPRSGYPDWVLFRGDRDLDSWIWLR